MRQSIPAAGYPANTTGGAPYPAPPRGPPGGPPAPLAGSAAAPKADVSLREKAKQQNVLADSEQTSTGKLVPLA